MWQKSVIIITNFQKCQLVQINFSKVFGTDLNIWQMHLRHGYSCFFPSHGVRRRQGLFRSHCSSNHPAKLVQYLVENKHFLWPEPPVYNVKIIPIYICIHHSYEIKQTKGMLSIRIKWKLRPDWKLLFLLENKLTYEQIVMFLNYWRF